MGLLSKVTKSIKGGLKKASDPLGITSLNPASKQTSGVGHASQPTAGAVPGGPDPFGTGPLVRDMPGPNAQQGNPTGFYGGGPALWQQLGGAQGAGPTGALRNIFGSFTEGSEEMAGFMEMAAPFLAGTLGSTPSYNYLQDFQKNIDPMQAFGGAAGQIGAGQQEATTRGQNELARSGLGRSSSRAAIASKAASGAGDAKANLFTNLYQQGIQDKQAAAGTAFDVERMIASLALGHNPDARAITQQADAGKASQADLISAGGGIAGGLGGMLLGAGII